MTDKAKKIVRDLRDKFAAKLRQSGLTLADAKVLLMMVLTAKQVASRFETLPAHRAGFVIPYFDSKGNRTSFYRFRYLEDTERTGFAAVATETLKNELRYAQPPGTLNELYLPPFMDWEKFQKDATAKVLITEGELKAACATRHGLPCIGLGGVWNFKSASARLPLLPQFREFSWAERPVYICYDSDAVINPQVILAENALARELTGLGANPYIARIPSIDPPNKTGLDDYIATLGVKDFKDTVLENAVEWEAAKELYALNEEVIYVVDPGLILRLDTLQRISPRAFIDHAYAPRIYYEEQITQSGTKLVERSAAKEWLKWPHRATVKRTTYAPGAPRITATGDLNVWLGWACRPKRGSIKPFTELLDYLFANSPPTERFWFEQWLAWPLRHPGDKIYSAVLMWGTHHGTGKSLVGYTMFKIYGRNATEIGDKDLYSNHNEWAENKQFVMGDEITGGEKKRNVGDRMKSMITQKQLRLNPKYISSYTVPDCINYYFTSNHSDAVFLEDTDRRFFIHEVEGKPREDRFYQKFMEWLNGDGPSALFYHLLHLDCTGFNPQGHAPMTASKRDMTEQGRSLTDAWAARLRDDPDSVLHYQNLDVPYSLFRIEEILAIFKQQNSEGQHGQHAIIRALRAAGFRPLNQVRIYQSGWTRVRLWALRNCEESKERDLKRLFLKERADIPPALQLMFGPKRDWPKEKY